MRLLSGIQQDIKFQFRHGIYNIYLILSVLYILLLNSVPVSLKQNAIILVVFTDPAILGFFFMGGIIILEKGQRTLESLFVTPYQIYEYMISKVLSLTLVSILCSFLIVAFTSFISFFPFSINFNFSPLMLLLAVTLSSVFFSLLGFPFAVKARTVNGYLISASLLIPVILLPLLDFLSIFKFPLLKIFPTSSSIVLLEAVFRPVSPLVIVLNILNLLIWITLSYIWAYKWFEKFVLIRIGDEK